MDITDNTLAYTGISIMLVLLLVIVISIVKYSCKNTDIYDKNGQLLLEDPVSEV